MHCSGKTKENFWNGFAKMAVAPVAVTSLLMSADPSWGESKPAFFVMAQATSNDRPNSQSNSDITQLRRLNSAIKTLDIADGMAALDSLQTSTRSKTLLEVARIRFERGNPFYDPNIGFALVNTLISRNSAQKGEAAFLAGRHYKSSRFQSEKTLAVQWFEKAADWGIHTAHAQLGDMFSKNLEDIRDLTKALYHHQIAAQKFSTAPIMQFARRIARLKSDQEDCGIDPYKVADKYLPILKTEAASGRSIASKELGRMFLKGIFVEQDFSSAKKWLSASAQAGDAGAMRELAMIHLKMPEDTSAQEKAEELLIAAANNGNGAAFSNLAKLYLLQNKPAADEQAVALYQKSVEAGYLNGLRDLRKIHDGEELLGKNPDRIERLSKAITKLEITINGYSAPQPDRALSVAELTNPADQQIDTTIVGSINGSQSEGLATEPFPVVERNRCSLAGELDKRFFYDEVKN